MQSRRRRATIIEQSKGSVHNRDGEISVVRIRR